MRRMLAAAAALCTLFAFSLPAHAWWNDDWNFRKELSLDLSAQGADVTGTPADVPVLIRLSIANFEFWSDAKPDGSDIRFVLGDDKTPLQFHVERWDATNQMAYIWVRMPRLSGGASTDKLLMYYGNPDAQSASDPGGTYDKTQVLTYHFSEVQGPPVDATAYGTNPSSSTVDVVPAALIAGGVGVGQGKIITVPVASALWFPGPGITISSWVRIYQAQADAYVAAIEGQGEGQGSALALGVRGQQLFARIAGPAGTAEVTQATGALAPGTWHHVALRATDAQVTLLLDGVEVGTTATRVPAINGTLTIGGSATGANFLTGELDEFQVAAAPRPTEWLLAAARSQGADAKLVVYGADAQKEGGQISYFGTIAKNLTVDGWVVIVICTIMLIIAALIIVLKALYLSRIESGNKKFFEDFDGLKGDSRVLDAPVSAETREFADQSPTMAAITGEGGKYGASTLFELYHAGIGELNKRIAGGTVGARRSEVLSSQSIEAIRASLDAKNTRVLQKLQAQMVLLTICISGGPFLGLLGTVIGVMVTFAAIAASGDVNVNAIAPGVAAALAATVAGLAVAIPCLFAYNWLNTRIKAITADNRVFADELVARFAEQYS